MRSTRRDAEFVLRRTVHGFRRHRDLDSAAALTFYACLSLFPGALALVSALSLLDAQGDGVTDLLRDVQDIAPDSAVAALEDPVRQLTHLGDPVLGLVVGTLLSLWTLSAYSTAFGRAMNTVYEVIEGRRVVLVRLVMLGLALLLGVVFVLLLGIVLITPRVARAIASSAGIGQPWISVWDIGKWPLLLLLSIVLIALLYFTTPNVAHERMRWIGLGALVAVVVGGLATAGFSLWATHVADYGRLYGWLGGGIVLLLWLYLVNLSLLVGAEVDAEVTRLGQLREGVAAEEAIRLRARDTHRAIRLAAERARLEQEGRTIREEATRARREQTGRARG